ncbi:hypothetical protein DL766_006117 [Monosporascus sp. MC13-8B]|uniref:Peptidase A1 domain-containing protein n=1 Tax=Monosporascus cannonballus TaxID=155416 RepID=A0ABY0HEX4_9PEZI|nr:hypothetical protein DL763_010333 [Monosporascus cannonballus]RYO91870.1 hypothetical protein DL762_001950 [Monosporascus cannonballus]RYP27988.1 hypothetical protein DL766_006117 [Monosporascus sp. MC13-8B]
MFSLRTMAMLFAIRRASVVCASALPSNTPKPISLPLTLIEGDGGQGPVYSANISMGGPPQSVTVQIVSGSSDLWVFSDKNSCHSSTYNSEASSTFQENLPGRFEFGYGSGNNGSSDHIRDDVRIGGVTAKNFRVGLANTTGPADWPLYGIMDMSFSEGEFLVHQGYPEHQYPVLQWYLSLTGVGVTVDSSSTTWFSNSSETGPAFLNSGSPKAFLLASSSISLILPDAASTTIDIAFGGSNEAVIRTPLERMIERYPTRIRL